MLPSPSGFIRLLLCTALLAAASARAQTVGEVLPPRPDGAMDLHHINTGEGNAAFCVLPDGTTLLIDCGFGYDLKRAAFYKAPRRPDESRTPGEWVARYIQHFHPDGEKGALDYLVISHFHSDHMGGVPELAQRVAIRHILDRGWPDYQQPLAFTGELAEKYRAALQAQVEQNGATVERFQPGRADQIVLRREPAKYPDFEVRNLAVNGELWTGQGTATRGRIPAGAKPEENTCSVVLRLRYGRFSYYSGGDLTGTVSDELAPGTAAAPAQLHTPAWRDMESAIAWVTGPVDVLLLDHHGNSDGSNAFFLSVLQPRVAISNVWASRQVDAETLARLQSEETYPGPRDLFTTNGIWPGRKEHLIKIYGEEGALRHIANLEKLAATQGHIVVRVAPGGESYTVFVLDDTAETFRIKSIHGPYQPHP